jgi:hypothetical protein
VRSTKSQQSAEALETRSQQISRQSSILSQPIEEDPKTSEYETDNDQEMAHASTSAVPQAQTPAFAEMPQMVQVLTEDLCTLMQGVLETVVMERAQARDQQEEQQRVEREQQLRVASTKDLKLTEPKAFSG